MYKLGLDVGIKSCGIALSDNTCVLAQGRENYIFTSKNWNILIKHIIDNYLSKYNIDEIIVGYPKFISGNKSQTTLMIEDFCNILKKYIDQKIIFQNEYLTTQKAYSLMRKMGFSKNKQKKNKDKVAAQIILQDYLDYSQK